jgi:F0F1-type ATP synthase assembly protein I
MSSDKLNTELLAEVLAYLLETEQQHYEESGEPDNHIYAKALQLQDELIVHVYPKGWA